MEDSCGLINVKDSIDNCNINALKEIKHMDTVLLNKIIEIEEMKLSRIQMEQDSLETLHHLIDSEIPNSIKNNLQDYLKLVRDSCNTSPNKVGNDCKSDGPPKKGIRSKKKSKIKSLTSYVNFMARNIQLAKCGMGTLSMTEEEKIRMDKLLSDDGRNEFSCDAETEAALKKIDKELQALRSKCESSTFRYVEIRGAGTASESNDQNTSIIQPTPGLLEK